MNMDRDIVAVVVTYAKRFNYLKKTIEAIRKQDKIKKIIIVQNGVEYDLKKHFFNHTEITVLQSSKNLGSAGGFWIGLKHITQMKTNKLNVLILDDDNIIDTKAIYELQKAEKLYRYNAHIWSLFRPNVQQIDRFNTSTEKTIKSLNNTINGFTFEHLIYKKKDEVARKYPKINSLVTAPYSGLFFPGELISNIGLPNRDFYLYSDDIDYTLRIKRSGFLILQCRQACCYDQSVAWQTLDKKNKKNRGAFFSTTEIYRPLYTYRNEVYISYHSLCTNKFILSLNYFLLQLWLFLSYMPKNRIGYNKFLQLKHAMSDGKKGILGKSVWIENTKG